MNQERLAIVIAIVFTALCGFVALAIDIGHMVMVKAELQRTADAGALAGAAGLVPYNNPGPNETPNWVKGQTKARTIVNNAANKADNQTFTITATAVNLWILVFKTTRRLCTTPPSPLLPLFAQLT